MRLQSLYFINPRPWPVLISISIGRLLLISVYSFFIKFSLILILIILTIFLILVSWWRDVIRESCFLGLHSFLVRSGVEIGIILFILSEVIFFFSFFWSFFYFRLSPSIEVGSVWPPFSIYPLNPFAVPFLNTIILLRSGVSLTCSHNYLIINDEKNIKYFILITISLGVYFSLIQLLEYKELSFCIRDGAYGSIFFIGTGFHGFHVIVGSLFLIRAFYRFIKKEFSLTHHLGLETAAWYWHFVDVVWIFLFIFIYWWSKI